MTQITSFNTTSIITRYYLLQNQYYTVLIIVFILYMFNFFE
uniref:Uncharacterized protein n=1 Tax=Chondria sp. (in: red algae) TaxID=1982705 RepID=A0A1Z1MQH4_9FLOR|nr:hypothetical protein [Chondria sp. (in: red algae)]